MNAMDMLPSLSQLTRSQVIFMERIGRGGNSKVYRISCENGGMYTAKCYFQCTTDGRNRMAVEFSTLRLLWENGVRVVPRPIVADEEMQVAIYEYIDGDAIPSDEVTGEDIDKVASFLRELKKMTAAEGSEQFNPASEACFSVQGIVDNISGRLCRLTALTEDGAGSRELRDFLENAFTPALETFTERAKSMMGNAAFASELPSELRTFSPSDCGFHNAVRRKNGDIVFLDFEYFGWDDPAKMISDFLLHPAMDIAGSLKERFTEAMLGCFMSDSELKGRFAAVYPLFGLKWCLILLNEFIPENLQRRMFATGSTSEASEIRMCQLVKARGMLQRVMVEHDQIHWDMGRA